MNAQSRTVCLAAIAIILSFPSHSFGQFGFIRHRTSIKTVEDFNRIVSAERELNSYNRRAEQFESVSSILGDAIYQMVGAETRSQLSVDNHGEGSSFSEFFQLMETINGEMTTTVIGSHLGGHADSTGQTTNGRTIFQTGNAAAFTFKKTQEGDDPEKVVVRLTYSVSGQMQGRDAKMDFSGGIYSIDQGGDGRQSEANELVRINKKISHVVDNNFSARDNRFPPGITMDLAGTDKVSTQQKKIKSRIVNGQEFSQQIDRLNSDILDGDFDSFVRMDIELTSTSGSIGEDEIFAVINTIGGESEDGAFSNSKESVFSLVEVLTPGVELQFTATAVPEPSGLMILAAAAVAGPLTVRRKS